MIGGQMQNRTGFALVIALGLMAFVLLLLVSLSAFVRVESEVSQASLQREKARQNALLALQVGLGRLQRTAGPDQRSTATASILDADPAVPGVQGVVEPHWLAVWDTAPSLDQLNRLPSAGDSYHDFDARIEDRRITWLVSGESPDPEAPLDPELTVPVYGHSAEYANGTVPPGGAEARVEVEAVPFDADAPRGERYAFWVSGENAKAPVSAFDPAAADAALPPERLRASFAVAQRFAIESIDGALDGFDDPNGLLHSFPFEDASTAWLTGLTEVPLLPAYGSLSDARRSDLYDLLVREGHDLTASSTGLLTDALRSGLRTDLSRLLSSDLPENLQVPDGVPRFQDGGAERITQYPSGTPDNPAPQAPSWAQMASFFQAGSELEDTGALQASGWTDREYPRFPVITRFRLDLHPLFERDSVNGDLLRIHAAPVVVLWNPFNVPLRFGDEPLWVDLLFESSPNGPGEGVFIGHDWIKHPTPGPALVEAFAESGPQTTGGGYPFGATDAANLLDHGGLTRFTDEAGTLYTGFSFRLPAITMEPGEVLSFGLAADGEAYDGSNLLAEGAFPLTPTAAILDNRDADGNRIRASVEWSNYKANLEPGWGTASYVEQGGLHVNMDIADPGQGARVANFEMALGLRAEAQTPTEPEDYLFLAESIVAANPNLPMLKNAPFAQGRNGRIGINEGGNENGFDDFNRMARRQVRFDVVAAGAFPNPANDLLGDSDFPYGFRLRGRMPATVGSAAPQHGPNAVSGNDAFANALNQSYGGMVGYSPYAETGDWGMHQPVVQVAADGGGYWGPGMNASDGGLETLTLFEVPRGEPGLLSLGALRHWPASVRGDGASYGIGAGRADPMVGASDNLFLPPEPAVAERGEPIPVDETFLLNHALWDSFFFSGQTSTVGTGDLDRGTSPWNARLRHREGTDAATLEDPLTAAAGYFVDGAFNVNSTSPAAWMALLASATGVPFDPVSGTDGADLPATAPRFVWPNEGSGDSATEEWNGYRALSEAELRDLAEAIVEEVKTRGPFFSLSDFVNRRLVAGDNDEGLFGTLEAAIWASGINNGLIAEGGKLSFADLPVDLRKQPNEIDARVVGPYWEGIAQWVTQADLLQRLGPLLTTRSDTFRIRAYGESGGLAGRGASALCEAIVQRIPEYIDPTNPPEAAAIRFNPVSERFENGSLSTDNQFFGRRFVVISFRWLPY